MDQEATVVQRVTARAKKSIVEKRHLSGWVLEKQESSCAPPGVWTNIDLDVTPIERRTWTSLTVLGYWLSDILNAQSWAIAATIIAVGLTWREAVLGLVLGAFIMAVPMAFNGAAGAYLHVPFPVVARSSFGFYFSRFAVVIRFVTALFWHAIQTFTGSQALTQMIRAIWPSYLDIPNTIPASMGVTSQQLVSHFLFWSIQLPFLLIAPHKLKWFFVFKAVLVTSAAVGTTIAMCVLAGGTGDIWSQQATVSGSQKSWLILYGVTSCTGSWSTVGTNISDFTRYLKTPRSVWTMSIWFPVCCIWLGMLGIITTSASKVLYGEYIWDPVAIAAQWDGPGGRAGAFFCGLAWAVAQIGVNVSANVISCSHDMMSLFPKYINLRRAAVITTITAAWVMVPWKIIHSAASLLNFMASLGVFLSPIMGISIADYWVVKRRRIDVPGLYDPFGRYRYQAGVNWRALVAMLCSVGPNLPGMAKNVNSSLDIGGAGYIADMVWFYGFFSAFFVHIALSYLFPDRPSLISRTIEVGDAIDLDDEEAKEVDEEGYSKEKSATVKEAPVDF